MCPIISLSPLFILSYYLMTSLCSRSTTSSQGPHLPGASWGQEACWPVTLPIAPPPTYTLLVLPDHQEKIPLLGTFISLSPRFRGFTLWSQLDSLPQAPIPDCVVGPSPLFPFVPPLCAPQLEIPCDYAQPHHRNLW